MVSGQADQLPLLAIAGAACWFCYKEPDGEETIMKCKSCLRASYCSRECQVQDWKGDHRDCCRVLQHVNKICAMPPEGVKRDEHMNFERYVEAQSLRLELAIKVIPSEKLGIIYKCMNAIIQHQPHCDNCYLNPFDSYKSFQVQLTRCPSCRVTFWCSEECRTKSLQTHAGHCTELKEMAILDRIWYVWDKKNTKPFMIPSISSSQIYIPPSTLQSWSEYFDAFKDSSNRTIASGHDLMDSGDLVLADRRNINHASKASSTTATILSGLEHTIPDLATRSSLRIDIVGAAFDELIAQGLNEDILHYCPSLTKLTISYVGPHVFEKIQGIHERNLCTACTDNGRTFVTAFVQGLYHERRLTDMKGRNVTDLICAFNSGHTADDSFETRSATWAPTLEYILASNKPALFTTYTRPEAELEEAVLDKMGANFILRPEINRWHGMVGRPLVIAPKGLMSYKNHYLYIIKGFKEGSQLAISQEDEDERRIMKQCIDKALAIDQSRD